MIKNSVLTILFLLVRSVILAQTSFSAVSNKLLICGHRGGFYDQLPENSMAAFESTANRDKSLRVMVEFDIRKSKDGTLFLMHDETVDRTTSGTGKIAELSDAYLSSLFLKNEKGERTSERIPTYDELLSYAAKTKNILLMLDVKADVWEEAIKKLKATGLESKSIVLTFKQEDTKNVYELSHNVVISCLVTDEEKWDDIEKLHIPAKNLVAYVSLSTSESLRSKIKHAGVSLMTDTSEHTTHLGKLYPELFYKDLVKDKNLNILITDFPMEVSKISFD